MTVWRLGFYVLFGAVWAVTSAANKADVDLCVHDAPYKKIVLEMQRSRDNLRKVRTAHQNDTGSGIYLTMIRRYGDAEDDVAALSRGNTTFFRGKCLHVQSIVMNAIDESILLANDAIPGHPPFTGESEIHEALRRIGRAFTAMIDVANSTFQPTSKYQAVIRRRGDNINGPDGNRALIARKDNGRNCILGLINIGKSLRNQREVLDDKGTNCTIASLSEPYHELPSHNCTITPVGCVGDRDLRA